jgi:hypothetical protein
MACAYAGGKKRTTVIGEVMSRVVGVLKGTEPKAAVSLRTSTEECANSSPATAST